MNKLVAIISIIGVCAAANLKCTEEEKNNQICTLDYNPVCGIKSDSTYQTYGNECSACSDENVEFYANGECESYPQGAIFCEPKSENDLACNKMIQPVCGLFDSSIMCVDYPCGQNYSNSCFACSDKNVTHYLENECEELSR